MGFTWGNIERVFQDPEKHAEFQEKGYVIVDLLDAEALEEVRKVYEKWHPEPQPGFYTTTFNQAAEHRQSVSDDIRAVVQPRLEKVFENFKIYFCSFITKAPGPKSELILHQDMSLVDESKYNGINVWCPLVDLTETNGAIEILEGSHRLVPTYRGASLPDIYDGLEKEVKAIMTPKYLKAGQAVIFDQSILHYSPPNLSDQVRPVINTFVAHKDARIVISYADREKHPGKVELIRQDEDFMMKYSKFGYNIFERPDIGESLGLVDYDFPSLSREMLEEKYGSIPVLEEAAPQVQEVPKPSGFRRLLQKLNLSN